VHAFQNALDHGLETADERRAKHKPAQGKISLRAVRTPRGTTLWLADDGRGLNLNALRAKGGRPDETDELAANRIFDSGVSTAERVTNVSGRGVGLDAVRSFVRKLGGEVTVVLSGAGENGFRPFELVIDLPPEATVGDPSRPSRPPPSAQPSYGSASSFPEPAQARSAEGK
jgi:K+-sensing histidine kinase KdpD